MPAQPIVVTGAAGFIGFHTARYLVEAGRDVVGIDNLNDYYDPNLKHNRLELLRKSSHFSFERIDIADTAAMNSLFASIRPQKVIHLAAQAGVRYSLVNPHAYVQANLVGFTNILEGCRHFGVEHLVYASTSSVYGANTTMPFSTSQTVDHPLTFYAATKKANEVMAHSYSHLFRLPTTGLRFFTVYGPWGRPDMMMYIFAKAMVEGRPIELFNSGQMCRDFTYVDDIVESVVRVADAVAEPSPTWSGAAPTLGESSAPYRIFNIGNNSSVPLMRVVNLLESNLGRVANKVLSPMQLGDVPDTWADVDGLARAVGFSPATPIETGVARFIEWFREYHRVS